MTPEPSSSNIEWRAYGRLSYGASHDLSAGMDEWALLRRHLDQYGLRGMATCVEVGCGGGRLTNALAQDFTTVHALDVSPERILQAKQVPHAEKIQFHLVDNPAIPLAADTADLCISTHVLQHIADRRVVAAYFREMSRVLRPGGCMLVHVPVIGAHGMTGQLTEVVRRTLKERVKAVVLMITRALMRLGFTRLPWRVDHYQVFSFVKLNAFLQQTGFHEIELRLLPWAGGHAYVFARKTTGSEGIMNGQYALAAGDGR